MFSRVREILQVPWPAYRPYRLFDERAEELGPYYVAFGKDVATDPIAGLQLGLEQHARWKRTGNRRARQLFLEQAEWAADAQEQIDGIRGCYNVAGSQSALAQGEAISLLLRAYQETRHTLFLDRAIDASIPLTVDLRDGGVLWGAGDDVILEGVAGGAPSHTLSAWICGLWGMLELSRTTNLNHVTHVYRRSLATLEKYLPRYDSGTWSYEDLLAAPTGFRRVASLQQHLLHVAQLNVLLSMTKNELFAGVAERWRRYGASRSGRLQAWTSGFGASLLALDPVLAPSGARSVI